MLDVLLGPSLLAKSGDIEGRNGDQKLGAVPEEDVVGGPGGGDRVAQALQHLLDRAANRDRMRSLAAEDGNCVGTFGQALFDVQRFPGAALLILCDAIAP